MSSCYRVNGRESGVLLNNKNWSRLFNFFHLLHCLFSRNFSCFIQWFSHNSGLVTLGQYETLERTESGISSFIIADGDNTEGQGIGMFLVTWAGRMAR